jgi:hypothetical protein
VTSSCAERSCLNPENNDQNEVRALRVCEERFPSSILAYYRLIYTLDIRL